VSGILERRPALRAAGLVSAGLGVALLAALAAGNPTPEVLVLMGGIVGAAAFVLALRFPFGAFLILVPSTILQLVIAVTDSRGVNAFDLLLPPLLLASILGATRGIAIEEDRRAAGAASAVVERAVKRLRWIVVLYFGLAILSLVPGMFTGRASQSADSMLLLIRGFQGLALFPLCVWWLRSEARIELVLRAAIVGALAFAAANTVAILFWGTRRAGLSWVLNADYVPMNGPNEAATAMLFVAVLVLARQSVRPSPWNPVLLALSFAMLIMTQSRSGLLAWLVLALLSIRWNRLKWILGGLVVVTLALPLIPDVFWKRITNTIFLERGTFEAYSSLVRVFGWKTAWEMFLDHPIFGVGYVCFRFLSDRYNDLGVILITAENYYLETATGMGIVGLAVLALVIVQMYRTGGAIRRASAPGTLAHAMARYHVPFFTALLVANLTGDNFVGMVGLAQLALWTGIMVQAGRLAARRKTG
jgi:O-antigen ligase